MTNDDIKVTPVVVAKRKGKSSFIKDVMTLGIGTSFGQAITIVAAPILTRLYNPDAFGLAALFVSLTGICIVISCLRFEMSIMLPEKDEEAANLLVLSVGIAIFISLLTVPVIWFGGDYLVNWFNTPNLKPYLWFLPVAVLLGGILLALNYWNSRARKFGRLSIAKISESTTTTSFQLSAGFVGFTTGGSLIIATLFGSLAAVMMLIIQVIRNDYYLLKRSVRWSEISNGFKRHKKFPLFDTWAALLNNISWQLPTFLLATFFSATEVGFYALGNRLLRLPMNLIGVAIGQVFFQRSSEALRDGSLARVVENAFRSFVILAMFPMFMLTIIGRDLFIVVFGQDWAEAGVYTQILSVWMFFWFISSPLSTLFRVLEQQVFSLGLNIVILMSRFVTLWGGALLGNARIALVLFSCSGVILYGYLCLAVMERAGVKKIKVFQILYSNFLLFLPAAIVLISQKILGLDSKILVGSAVIILTLYGFYLYRYDPTIRELWIKKTQKNSQIDPSKDNITDK